MATRNRKGDGCIAYRKSNGTYEARLWVTAKDGTKFLARKYAGKDRKKALEILKDLRAKDEAEEFMTRKDQTIEVFLNNWIPKAPKINDATRIKYARTVRKYLIPHLGKIKLSELTRSDIRRLIDIYIEEDVGARTIQLNRSTLSSALNYAVEQGLLKENIVLGKWLRMPSYRPKKKELWDINQALHFHKYAKQSPLHPIYELLLCYGLRRGEALGLAWEAIDFEKDKLHITQQLTFVGNELRICPTKTENSERTLPLLPNIKALLLAMKPKNATGLIFEARNDGMVKPSVLQYDFERLISKAKLPYMNIHRIRHFTATILKTLGVPDKDIQLILGHADVDTTIRCYEHSTQQDQKAALEKLAAVMQF